MEAIVLAGGFGTRLKSMVHDIPKPMAPVNGKPFLTFVLDELEKYHFTKVVLAVGYKYEIIMSYFGNSYKNMTIEYAIENEPLGTGGAILQAVSLITSDYFFVINGDTLFKIDFNQLILSEPLVIASKYLSNNTRYGQMKVESDYITAFQEKGLSTAGYINGGIYYISKEFLVNMSLPKKFSFEKELLEIRVKNNSIRTVIFDSYFIDMGIPEDYVRLQEDLK